MIDLAKLTDHCIWANELWIGFISENCPADEYLLTRMSHILLGEQAWFDRISGKEPNRNIWTAITIPSLQEEQQKHRSVYQNLVAGNIDRVIAYKRFTGEEYQSSIADILLHLTLHGAHHRGQMATHVSGRGMKPINADFIQYCLSNRL